MSVCTFFPFGQDHFAEGIDSTIVTARVCWKVMFSYRLCVSVCVSVWAITFECLDIETSFLVCGTS